MILDEDKQETVGIERTNKNGISIITYVQLVRCKDCKKRESWECWQYFFGRIKIPDDWFCADGERKCGE